MDAIASAKRSLQYDFNKKIGQLVNNLNIKYGLANIATMDLMSDVTGLGIAIPITSIDDFIEFDSNLNDNNKEKLDIVKKFILVKVEAAGHFKKAIGSVMSAFMNKDVQLKFSAKGKIINGTCKKNFSSTNLYKIIEVIVCSSYKDVKKEDVIKHIGSWLAGAKDREGGKRKRETEKFKLINLD
ncbi:hypothetical protein PV325_003759 [Microctonus aethiopoides]|nr:hypothetical protein PV325_003759 [Microctonus aethiopoides]